METKTIEIMVNEVVTELKRQNLSITAAESLTAGLFQSSIASVSGASQIFSGGFVTYANEVKEKLLGIPHEVIQNHTVVSAEVAKEMAERARILVGTKIGVSLTGVAGPDALEGHPVGTVWIGISGFGQTVTVKKQFTETDNRNTIREKSVLSALSELQVLLKK